jgi:hypothetical protein
MTLLDNTPRAYTVLDRAAGPGPGQSPARDR